MNQEIRERIRINNEKGIVRETGGGFHSPLESAARHMFYAVWSGRYECNRIYSVRRDHLDFYSVIYVLDGQLEVEYEGKIIQAGPNEAVLLDFHKPHAYRAVSDRVDKWEMLFKGNESAAWYEMVTGDGEYLFKAAGRLQRTLTGLMEELNSPCPQDHTISLLIHTMFCNMIDQNAVTLSPPVEEAILFMNSRYGDSIQIGEIADHVSLSRFYFRDFSKKKQDGPRKNTWQIYASMPRGKCSRKGSSPSQRSRNCAVSQTLLTSPDFSGRRRDRRPQPSAAALT